MLVQKADHFMKFKYINKFQLDTDVIANLTMMRYDNYRHLLCPEMSPMFKVLAQPLSAVFFRYNVLKKYPTNDKSNLTVCFF
jgi:hypothetical protein